MNTSELLLAAVDANQSYADTALDGLTDEDLHRQPTADSNHIDWLAWHMTRAEDSILSAVTGQPQLWVSEGWHKKWGMDDSPGNSGGGWTAEQVAAFRSPNLATLRSYMLTVRKRTKGFLKDLAPSDLDRSVTHPRTGASMRAGEYLGRWLVDQFQHTGQIAYLRGVIRGRGWLPR